MIDVFDRLKEITSAVMYAAEGTDLEAVLERIAAASRRLVGAKYAALGVPDGEGGLRYFKVSGITQEEIDRLDHLPRGHGLIGAIMQERQPIRLPRMQDDPRSVGFPEHHPPMTRFLGVPIQTGPQLFGMLYLCDREDGMPFDENDQTLIETMAGYAALAIAGAELSQQRSRLRLLEERERISMELHDGIIQSLYGIGMQVDLLRQQGEAVPADSLNEVIDSLNEVIEDIRHYILDLRTRSETLLTVRACLADLLDRLHLPETIEVELDAPDTRPPFHPAAFESICLIVNEALSNAVRHAEATRIAVTAYQQDREFVFIVRDNGRGFDRNHVDGRGLGLYNMQQRARLYGGQVDVETGEGTGTSLTIHIPIR